MSPDGRRLANRLKIHRARKGLTQGQLADAVSVSRRTVNSVENNVFVPSTELALRMAEVLEVPVEELFFLTGPDEGSADQKSPGRGPGLGEALATAASRSTTSTTPPTTM